MKLFLLLLFSLPLAANDCPGMLKVKLENEKEAIYCEYESLLVSPSCFKLGDKCSLVEKYKAKKSVLVTAKVAKQGAKRNPGSLICQMFGWKVLMGEMFDGSQVCTCENASGESVVCSSMIP